MDKVVKIIAIEEHFVTGDISAKWGRLDLIDHDDSVDLFPSDSIIEKRLADLSDDRLARMDEIGVDVQVLLLTTPGTQGLEPKDAVPHATRANDQVAATVRRHPDRYQVFATLPASIRRLRRELCASVAHADSGRLIGSSR